MSCFCDVSFDSSAFLRNQVRKKSPERYISCMCGGGGRRHCRPTEIIFGVYLEICRRNYSLAQKFCVGRLMDFVFVTGSKFCVSHRKDIWPLPYWDALTRCSENFPRPLLCVHGCPLKIFVKLLPFKSFSRF